MLGLAAMAWTRRASRGASTLVLVCVALAAYVTGYGFEIASHSVDEVRLWFKIEYLGIATLPALVLMAAAAYTGLTWFRRRLNLALLFFIPAVSLFFAWTNETNAALWGDLRLQTGGPFAVALFERGPWYWVNGAYAFLAVLAGVAILARAFRRETGLYRRQLGVMLIGLALPFAVYVLYIGHVTPPGLDVNAYVQLVGITIVAWGMLSYQILDIAPIAKEVIVSTMHDAVLVFDSRLRLVDLNPAAFMLVGAVKMGIDLEAVFAGWPDLKALVAAVSQPESASLGLRHQAQVYDATVTSIMDKRGRVDGHLIVLRDNTDRMDAQIAIQDSNERLQTLRLFDIELARKLKLSYVTAIATDAAIRMSRADAAMIAIQEEGEYRILNAIGRYSQQQVGTVIASDKSIAARVVRTRVADLTRDVSADPDYEQVIAGTQAQITVPLLSGENLFGLLVLETSHADYFSDEVFDTIKLLAARIAVAVDNSILYEERDRLVQELEAFAHTVAHDLKNPLAAIHGLIGLIGMTPPDKLPTLLEKLQTSVNATISIVDALLLLAKVRSEGMVEMSVVNMESSVQNVSVRLNHLLERYEADLNTPQTWPPATGYAPWVEEIWANYISNALKYGGEPPKIQLGWDEQPDQQVRFWVQDNGRGLTAGQIKSLFQPFTRLDSSRAEGHGLGLSIVQRIAERLHGEAGVESTVGEGSKFYFTLPADNVSGEVGNQTVKVKSEK